MRRIGNPHVEPTSIRERTDGKFEVTVQQLVKDLQGHVVFDGPVKYIYTVQDGLLKQIDSEQVGDA